MFVTEIASDGKVDGKMDLWYAVTGSKVTFDAVDSSVIQTVLQIDGLGNMTSKFSTESVTPNKSVGDNLNYSFNYVRTYAWNEKNQLISSVDSNYNTAYVYGQDGQRSNKYTQSSETLYFNRMWTLHTDSGNNIYGGQTAKNIYLGETRIVTKLNSGTNPTYQEEYYKQYFYHSDHLGSASLISDYKGDEYQRIEYTPYGESWVEKTQNTGLEWLPYKFTSKELDEETGLYYYGARYLDPKYSRWISTDPALGEYIPAAGKAGSQNSANLPGMGGVFNHINGNLYHYAGNNPVKYTDPDGKAVVVYLKYGLIGGNENEKYAVRSQTYFEKTVFEKVQAQFYPIKDDDIVSLSYLLSGEHRIKEGSNSSSFTDNALTAVSVVGGLKITKGLEKAGKIAGRIGRIKFGIGLFKSYKSDIRNCAIEELTCDLFMHEMASDSAESSEKLYNFAKNKINLLYESGNLTIDYDSFGGVKNFAAKNPLDIEVIRNDLNNYKRELKLGLPNE